jgi:hypothetical protein
VVFLQLLADLRGCLFQLSKGLAVLLPKRIIGRGLVAIIFKTCMPLIIPTDVVSISCIRPSLPLPLQLLLPLALLLLQLLPDGRERLLRGKLLLQKVRLPSVARVAEQVLGVRLDDDVQRQRQLTKLVGHHVVRWQSPAVAGAGQKKVGGHGGRDEYTCSWSALQDIDNAWPLQTWSETMRVCCGTTCIDKSMVLLNNVSGMCHTLHLTQPATHFARCSNSSRTQQGPISRRLRPGAMKNQMGSVTASSASAAR